MADSEAVEQAARELYSLPPGEFTGARDARVKELRKEGDREAADAVKAFRRPTVAAWALNQLARTRAKDLERLLAAGEKLRSAQEELLGGGDRAAFQEAAAAERDLVAELAADATTLASEAGERGGGMREKVSETLHAAALDEDTAAELRAGRLTREREAIGGFGAPGGGPAPAPAPRGAGPRRRRRRRSERRSRRTPVRRRASGSPPRGPTSGTRSASSTRRRRRCSMRQERAEAARCARGGGREAREDHRRAPEGGKEGRDGGTPGARARRARARECGARVLAAFYQALTRL